jgi:tetratricopeptide (TPR) repeat protein
VSGSDPDKETTSAEDAEVDGLLDSLTNDSYREEQETLAFTADTRPPPPVSEKPTPPPPAPPPRAEVEKPKMPLPPPRIPRPGEGAPAVGSSSAPARAPRTATGRPVPVRPVPRPTKGLPGGGGIDDAEIDAALMPLSAAPPAAAPLTPSPPAPAAPAPAGPTVVPAAAAPPTPPPPTVTAPRTQQAAASTDDDYATVRRVLHDDPEPLTEDVLESELNAASLAPNPDSWLPPAFDESLDDLEAVELDGDAPNDGANTRAGPSLETLAASLSEGERDAESAPNVDALDEELDDWDEDRITSVPAVSASTTARPVSRKSSVPAASVEVVAASLDDLGISPEDADVDALLGLDQPAVPHKEAGATTPAPTTAVAQLGGHRLIDAWVARAEWFEAEALATDDVQARARLLLAASELWAMSGSIDRSRDAAKRAAAAWPSLSLASRQARALGAIEGDWKAVAAALDVESRSASTDVARAHAAYFSAETHRVALNDAEGAERRMDALAKMSPDDPRPYLARLAAELGRARTAPKTPPKDAASFAPLAAAQAELSELRAPTTDGEPSSASVAFKNASRAVLAGDRAAAGAAALALRDVPGLGDGALLLAAALFAPASETRPRAVETLRTLLGREKSDVVRRALAARALEQGDREAMDLVLTGGDANDTAFTPSDRVALGALTGADGSALSSAAETIAGDESQRPLAAAAASASAVDAPGLPVGEPGTYARIALGRRLATAGSLDDMKDAVHALRAAAPEAELGRVLSLELDAAAGASTAVATELARFAPAESAADGKLAAALIEEAAGRADAARRSYTSALGAPDRAEAAARALASTPDQGASDLLAMLSSSLGDESTTRQSLLLYEAAIRGGLAEASTVDLLVRAHDAAPTLPFASHVGIELARAATDVPKLLEWLRKQQSAATDPISRALGAVREALLVADDDPAAAAACLATAVTAHPDDVALRELEGRLSATPNVERGRWRERVAEMAVLPRTRAWFLFEAMNEYERAGAVDDAARAARAASELGDSALAKAVAARRPENTTESVPEGLAAARALEHRLLATNDDEALEALSNQLIDQLDHGEALAHARLAARLRMRSSDWATTRDLAERAAARRPASLWALRQASAHARFSGDDTRLFELDQELSDRAERPLDRATLALRAAEAAARLGRWDEALLLLGRTIENAPDHLVALELRAQLEEHSEKFTEAATDLEALARTAAVPEHRCDAWYRAAVVWGDKVGDQDRSLAALEQVLALDVSKNDVFERLQAQYVRRGDRAKLAGLLEARLERTTAPEERISLEVTRGRALADVGDRDAARRALGAALEANPDHADALEAYGTLALAEGDFRRAEETFIRLARVASSPEKQAEIYERLARLYDTELPNPQRSEICYREILKRKPNDPEATSALVRVYGRLGDVVKAVQLQTELVDRSTDPEEKRKRTLDLALVYDESAKDKRSALAILEKARKAWPHDPAVLRAMAGHHERHGETAAQNVLLDRAAAEARRALAHGRFDLPFFGVLQAVADIRGQTDAALVASATLSMLEGKRDVRISGAGAAATGAELEELTAPELLGPALRSLLAKLPTVLDTAYPVDLKSLRASPLPPSAADLGGEIRAVAESMGTRSLELLVSPMIGPVFLPASCTPARLVIGQSLLESSDEETRYFLLVRALKMMQTEVAAFSRIAPIELTAVLGALIGAVTQNWQAQAVDPNKLADARRRIEPAVGTAIGADLPTLALEIAGTIGNRASQLGQAVAQWASRTALLAVGSPSLALRGVAFGLGQADGLPTELAERLKWVLRNPEARDLCVFSVSDTYAEARRRVGLGV